jgi:hypothetical protein
VSRCALHRTFFSASLRDIEDCVLFLGHASTELVGNHSFQVHVLPVRALTAIGLGDCNVRRAVKSALKGVVENVKVLEPGIGSDGLQRGSNVRQRLGPR